MDKVLSIISGIIMFFVTGVFLVLDTCIGILFLVATLGMVKTFGKFTIK